MGQAEHEPKLLVSVRDRAEAEQALQGGADIVDVKDPANGSLGRASLANLNQIASVVDNLPLTAALGELDEALSTPREFFDNLPLLLLVKVGFANQQGRDYRDSFKRLRGNLSSNTSLIPAAYADFERCGAPPLAELIDLAEQWNSSYFLIDTCIKDGKGLLDWLPLDPLKRIARDCRSRGIRLAVAGSLKVEDIYSLRQLADVIAVRGAACQDSDRQAAVVGPKVRLLKTLTCQTQCQQLSEC